MHTLHLQNKKLYPKRNGKKSHFHLVYKMAGNLAYALYICTPIIQKLINSYHVSSYSNSTKTSCDLPVSVTIFVYFSGGSRAGLLCWINLVSFVLWLFVVIFSFLFGLFFVLAYVDFFWGFIMVLSFVLYLFFFLLVCSCFESETEKTVKIFPCTNWGCLVQEHFELGETCFKNDSEKLCVNEAHFTKICGLFRFFRMKNQEPWRS